MARVFIGMPTYNGEKYIRQHLQAFANQTFRDFELVVADNASTDSTEEICREFAARDPRIRYVRREQNLGAAKNVNLLIESCQSEYFKIAADDDLHEPEYLERCVRALDADPSIVLACTRSRLIDEQGQPCPVDPESGGFVDFSGRRWRVDSASRRLASNRPHERYHDLIHHTVLVTEIWGVVRHEALMKTWRFQKYFGSDRPMLAQLALIGRFHTDPEELFSLRLHPTHTTRQAWRARGDAVDPTASTLVKRFTGIQTYRDFLRAIFGAKISFGQKLRCLASWTTLLANPRILNKLFVPGPFNFFGIDFGTRTTRAS